MRERKRESFQEACRGKRNVFKEREKERERESDPNGRKPEGRRRKSAFRHGSGSPRKVHGLREVINDGACGVGGREQPGTQKKKKKNQMVRTPQHRTDASGGFLSPFAQSGHNSARRGLAPGTGGGRPRTRTTEARPLEPRPQPIVRNTHDLLLFLSFVCFVSFLKKRL